MNIKICDNLITSQRIAEQMEMSNSNICKTYIQNRYGRDKSCALRVVAYGALCTEAELTPKELMAALEYIRILRGL